MFFICSNLFLFAAVFIVTATFISEATFNLQQKLFIFAATFFLFPAHYISNAASFIVGKKLFKIAATPKSAAEIIKKCSDF